MKPIRARQDDGFTLVEVIVAMMVFALIAIGVAAGLASTLRMTSDARAREVATNLAAQEIDLLRSVTDIFTIVTPTSPTTVALNGVTFHVKREAVWVTSGSADADCGSGGGSLQYKRINVSVTWDGMRATTPAVRSDTILAPNGRINDPSLGTILVSVLNASGTGSENITVTAMPSALAGNTAVTPTTAILPTDAQGCTYILKVAPGQYNVKVAKSGYVDSEQSLDSSTRTVDVVAGTAASAGFQFDLAAKLTATYASGTVTRPTDLETSYISTYGTYYGQSSVNPAKLHPFPAGYVALAGHYIDPTLPSGGCKSVDPAAWPRIVSGATTYIGAREPAKGTTPGGSVPIKIPMGVASISVKGVGGTYLNAVSQTTAPGTDDPGCAVGMQYTFGSILSTSSVQSLTIALPYGSWKLYSSDSSTGTTSQVTSSAITPTNTVLVSAPGIVTFDPRVAVTP